MPASQFRHTGVLLGRQTVGVALIVFELLPVGSCKDFEKSLVGLFIVVP